MPSPSVYSVRKPLQKRLVTLVVLTAALAMLISFTFVFFLMRSFLYQRVDEQLKDGLDTWVGQSAPLIPSYGAPSDFHQMIWRPEYGSFEPITSTTPPDYEQLSDFGKAQTIGSVTGSEFNRQWRAMAREESNGTCLLYTSDAADE